MRKRRTKLGNRRNDIAAIKRLAMCWRAGWLAGDVETLVSLYGQSPVLMPQGRPAICGKAAIRSLYRAVLGAMQIQSTGTLREVEVAGDWGYFWSTYSLRASPKRGGEVIRSRGKSLFIVKRQTDAAWKIARLIDNSDE